MNSSATVLAAVAATLLGRDLAPAEHTALHAALAAVRADAAPTLPRLVDALADPDHGAVSADRTTLAARTRDGADLVHALRRLTRGDLAGMFDGPSTHRLDPSAPMVVLDLSALGSDDTALAIAMTCASAWLDAGPRRSDADRELGAYGIANLLGGLFGAPFSVGIPARSLANVRCGGTTRMSNLFHALFVLLFLTAGSSLVAHVPLSALAGVTAWMGFCLLDWSTWSRLGRMRRTDAAAFLLTALGVLFVNAAIAVAAGWSMYGFRWLVQRSAFAGGLPDSAAAASRR